MSKTDGKNPLAKPSCRWEDGVKMDLTEIFCKDVDWILVLQDTDRWRALVNTVMNLEVS
jgi:hypothetical protein